MPCAIFCITSALCIYADAASTQDAAPVTDLWQDVTDARHQAAMAARRLEDDLAALMPSVPGWICRKRDRHPEPHAIAEIPLVSFTCDHEIQSIVVSLVLDASSAWAVCKRGEIRMADAQSSDALRVFSGGDWRILRAGVDLDGCNDSAVTMRAQGERSDAAIAAGPQAIDAFATAMFDIDTAMFLTTAAVADHAAALDHLMELLSAQSRQFADVIARLPGAATEVSLSTMKQLAPPMRLPVPAIIGSVPGASTTLEIGDCRILA